MQVSKKNFLNSQTTSHVSIFTHASPLTTSPWFITTPSLAPFHGEEIIHFPRIFSRICSLPPAEKGRGDYDLLYWSLTKKHEDDLEQQVIYSFCDL